MLAAGVPILEALSMLEQQSENKHLVEALGDVRQDIMKGETLAVAMRRQAEVFPERKPYTTEDTVTIRAMGMPLFDLY